MQARRELRCNLRPLVLAVLMLTGCKAYVSVPTHEAPAVLGRGDRVRVRTTDGRRMELVVDSVTDDALDAPHERIPFADVATVEREQLDLVRSGGAAIGSGFLFVFIATATVF